MLAPLAKLSPTFKTVAPPMLNRVTNLSYLRIIRISNRLFDIFAWFGLTIKHAQKQLSSLARTKLCVYHSITVTSCENTV